MCRIVNPTLMRMGMNAIKKNVDSYGSNYRKAKSTLARYSNEAISAKGMTENEREAFTLANCASDLNRKTIKALLIDRLAREAASAKKPSKNDNKGA